MYLLITFIRKIVKQKNFNKLLLDLKFLVCFWAYDYYFDL